VRMGASVRGAIDLVRLGRQLGALRGEPDPAPGDATFADAAVAALSGRLHLEEGSETTPEAVVLALIERLLAEDRQPGKASARPGASSPAG
jgi:MoxR-like ATPase